MPAKSKQQFKFLRAVAEGYVKKKGLSPKKASEYTKENQGPKAFSKLPTKVKSKK